jgi:hypothetical protein
MARQSIDIGVQGNDGTGDSIRESFRKVNANFNELYAIFNTGDRIGFTDLDGTPNTLGSNQILTSDDAGAEVLARDLVQGNNVTIDVSDPTKITISATGGDIVNDEFPTLGGPLNGLGVFPIGKIAEPSVQAVQDFNDRHGPGGTTVTIDELAITKGYADRRYIQQTGGSSAGQIRLRDEPLNALGYTKLIDVFADGNASITDHGYDSGADGISFTYNSTGGNATGLAETVNAGSFIIGRTYIISSTGSTTWTSIGAVDNLLGTKFIATGVGTGSGVAKPVYFLKYVSASQLSFFHTFEDARNGTNRISVSGGSGVQTLTDAFYDSNLEGFWLSNEALPRKGVVRRQGDTMTGALTLHDHPGSLAGSGTPNGDDDLQAASKYYVDNSSFASTINLFVSVSGDDNQTNTPPGKEGRALAYAFSSVYRACEYAETLVSASLPEPGPYQQVIAYGQGIAQSRITSIGVSPDGFTRVFFTNNNGVEVDQGNPANNDITPGKLLQGMSSGARATIIYYYGADGSSTIGEDYIDVDIVVGNFTINENLKYGESVKELNITINIESGIYYEDLPIRLPPNVAIIGDEMRRTIIRPRNRISQSKWSNIAFFRDSTFDGLRLTNYVGENLAPDTTATPSQLTGDIVVTLGSGTASSTWIGAFFRAEQGASQYPAEGVITAVGSTTFSVTLHDNFTSLSAVASGNWTIFQTANYGRHYLQDPALRENTIILDIEDLYPNASALLVSNTDLIKDEVVRYIDVTYPSLSYDPIELSRNIGLIVDAMSSDLLTGKIDNVLSVGEQYFDFNRSKLDVTTQKTETLAGIQYVNTLAQQIIDNVTVSPKRGSVVQVTDLSNPGETGSDTRIAGQVSAIKAVIGKYDADSIYNPPKNNMDMDVFLCGDSVIIRQVCVQGHGGFMMALDPVEQILSKSPYCQQSSSFSGSLNKQRFAGGQFVDGFSGNLTATVISKVDPNNIDITLIDRKPQVPSFFQVEANRFRIDAVRSAGVGYENAAALIRVNKNFIKAQVVSKIAQDNPTLIYSEIKINNDVGSIVDAMVHDLLYSGNSEMLDTAFAYYVGRTFQLSTTLKPVYVAAYDYIRTMSRDIIANVTVIPLQTDVTQITGATGETLALAKINTLITNTLLVIINNGVTSAPARSYPTYRLLLADTTPLGTTVLNTLPRDITIIGAGNTSMLSNDFTQINDLGYGLVATNKGLIETVSVFSYYCHTAFYAKSGGQIRSLNGSTAYGVFGLVAEGGDPLEVPDEITLADDMIQVARAYKLGVFVNAGDLNDTSWIVYNFSYPIAEVSDIEINHGSTLGIARYEVNRCEDVSLDAGLPAGTLIRINLTTSVSDTLAGLIGPLTHDQSLIIRGKRSFRFYDVTETNPIRPSTALTFIGDPTPEAPSVYRAVAYANSNSIGVLLQTAEQTPISSVSRTSNVATVITTTPHGLLNGKFAAVDIDITSFNTAFTTVTVIDTVTFTYTNVGTNVTTTTVTGFCIPNKEAQIRIDQDYRYILLTVKQLSVVPGDIVSLARAADVATVYIDEPHGLYPGEIISINASDDLYDVDYVTIIDTPDAYSVTYANPGASEATKAGTGTMSILTVSRLGYVDISFISRNGSNVARAVCARPHGLQNGDVVDISIDDATYNDTGVSVTIVSSTIFTYSNLGSLETEKFVAGTVIRGTSTLGATIGDRQFAISRVSTPEIARLNTGQMLTAWNGKIFRITNYFDKGVSANYGIVSIADYFDIESDPTVGLTSSLTFVTNADLASNIFSLRAGLSAEENVEILVNISTCRATGHDFLDIGTGGYNASNYPSKIYGRGGTPGGVASEVVEITQGRVFWISTDQNGFFRVGRFFTVDQGTGSVSFNANIGLTGLSSLALSAGREIREFSEDSEFIDMADDSVPTENAIGVYIDRRLGLDKNNVPLVSLALSGIGPGYMDRAGILEATDDLRFGGFKLTGVGAPLSDTDAANKLYVDSLVAEYDSVDSLKNVNIFSPQPADVAAFPIAGGAIISATISGDITATFSSADTTTLVGPITGITQLDVNSGITVVNIAGFPTSGYLKINNEIFFYASVTGASNRFDDVVRLSVSSATDIKFGPDFQDPSTHSAGSIVHGLNDAQLNYQINPGVIVDADVNSGADIAQSKLLMNLATTRTSAPTGTDRAKQNLSGLASFDSANFEITDGFVAIKNGGVSRLEMASIDNRAILGNFTGSASFPQQVSSQSIVEEGLRTAFNTVGVVSITAVAGTSPNNVNSYAITSVTTSGGNDSLVKTLSAGEIDVKQLKVDGYKIIDTASTHVEFYSPAAGTAFNFMSSAGTDATGITYIHNNLDVATGLTVTGTTTLTGEVTATNITTGSVLGNGSLTGVWTLLDNSKLVLETGGVIDALAGTLQVDNITTGSNTTRGDIQGEWHLDGTFEATYADLAEWYTSDQEYEPGTVLVFGGTAEVTTTFISSDSRVAGVVTTNPAYVMNKDLQGTRACIALQGRVPVKVLGIIKKGDLITTAAQAGYGCKAMNPQVGTIIGKALADKLDPGKGIVEVAVGRI